MDAFTDVIIRCYDVDGKMKEIKCHNAVLSARSERFKKTIEEAATSPETAFTVLLFKDDCDWDDAEDLEQIIKYIYTNQYTILEDDSWMHHVARAGLARRYGLPGMERDALKALEQFSELCDLDDVVDFLKDWNDYEYTSDGLEKILEDVRRKRADAIAQQPKLALLLEDTDIMKKCLENIVAAKSQGEHDVLGQT